MLLLFITIITSSIIIITMVWYIRALFSTGFSTKTLDLKAVETFRSLRGDSYRSFFPFVWSFVFCLSDALHLWRKKREGSRRMLNDDESRKGILLLVFVFRCTVAIQHVHGHTHARTHSAPWLRRQIMMGALTFLFDEFFASLMRNVCSLFIVLCISGWFIWARP